MASNSEKSFWDLKPYWCQPWSIIGFGISLIYFSWNIFNNLFITIIVSFLTIIWWILFLILTPNSYKGINDKK